MKENDFKAYCKRYIAPKKVVDDYFSNEENLKDNYTSEDTDAVYKFYMKVLADAPKEVHRNPHCSERAGGGKKTRGSYHWNNWDNNWWG